MIRSSCGSLASAGQDSREIGANFFKHFNVKMVLRFLGEHFRPGLRTRASRSRVRRPGRETVGTRACKPGAPVRRLAYSAKALTFFGGRGDPL
jgi:hypothetical protein